MQHVFVRTAAPTRLVLRVVAAAGLVADAVVHLLLARNYDVVTGVISQGTLFRIESVVSVLVAALVLLTRWRWAYALGALVALSALVAVVVSTYVHVGAIGPIPDMYEPIWYPEKTFVTVAEAVAAVASLILFFLPSPTATRRRQGSVR